MQYAGPASEEREAIQVPELDWPADLFVDPSWQTKDQRVSPAEYSELPNSWWLTMKDLRRQHELHHAACFAKRGR
jgi:hypothetical protein